jgi:hypothetical protein
MRWAKARAARRPLAPCLRDDKADLSAALLRGPEGAPHVELTIGTPNRRLLPAKVKTACDGVTERPAAAIGLKRCDRPSLRQRNGQIIVERKLGR